MPARPRFLSGWSPHATALAGILLAAVTAAPRRVAAESPRFELGRRLRAFEEAWQEAPPQSRARAREPMEAAVRSFFSLALPDAAASLDDARCAVEGEPGADVRRAMALEVAVTPALADVDDRAGPIVALRAFYARPEAAGAPPAPLLLEIVDEAGTARASRETRFDGEGLSIDWADAVLPAGDHHLVVSCRAADGPREIARVGLSRVAGLRRRLDALAAEPAAEPASPTARATVRALVALLEDSARSRPRETALPADRLLAFAEALADPARPDPIPAAARTGDLWLTLSHEGAEVPVRLRAPNAADGPMPVLFLFHGAGGSENMFFETCGAGRAVSLGTARGWLVVAPRQGIFGLPLGVGGMLAALERHFPVDRTRVFLAGHSMGAAQVTRQVQLFPGAATAAAALGGGGTVPSAAEAGRVPWFVAAGAHDFGRGGARRLADGLSRRGNAVEWREYADVEHMVVVQAALDDLFAFFDSAAADEVTR